MKNQKNTEESMRFLFAMLSCIWLLFGWASFSAMRYSPPQPPPWHAAAQLHKYNSLQLENQIRSDKAMLTFSNIPEGMKARLHFNLANYYWILTYFQKSRAQQTALLKASLQECLTILKYSPENRASDAWLFYCIADLYHQLGDFENAEMYYKKSLKMYKDSPQIETQEAHVLQRYDDLVSDVTKVASK